VSMTRDHQTGSHMRADGIHGPGRHSSGCFADGHQEHTVGKDLLLQCRLHAAAAIHRG